MASGDIVSAHREPTPRKQTYASRLERDRESNLIGAIYDCTLYPDRWEETLQTVCRALGGYSAGIVLLDYNGHRDRLVRDWGPTPVWGQRMGALLDSIKFIHRQFLGISGPQAEEPILLPPALAADVEVFNTPFYREWAAPQQIHQVLEAVALSEPTRLGLFCVTRHQSNGHFTTEQIDQLRRLAPHIRRAITISDLLDLKTVERQAFVALIEHLAAAVLVVGADGCVMHANPSAEAMLKSGRLIRAEGGKRLLRAIDPACRDELLRAIASSQGEDQAGIGRAGISVPLRGNGSDPAVAHVLPLAKGEIRTRLVPQALAAVFINGAGEPTFTGLGALARAFELTPAETRLVERLIAGDSLVAAARALEISENTAKTQRDSIFRRVGVSRQIDLLDLIRRLLPPVR